MEMMGLMNTRQRDNKGDINVSNQEKNQENQILFSKNPSLMLKIAPNVEFQLKIKNVPITY